MRLGDGATAFAAPCWPRPSAHAHTLREPNAECWPVFPSSPAQGLRRAQRRKPARPAQAMHRSALASNSPALLSTSMASTAILTGAASRPLCQLAPSAATLRSGRACAGRARCVAVQRRCAARCCPLARPHSAHSGRPRLLCAVLCQLLRVAHARRQPAAKGVHEDGLVRRALALLHAHTTPDTVHCMHLYPKWRDMQRPAQCRRRPLHGWHTRLPAGQHGRPLVSTAGRALPRAPARTPAAGQHSRAGHPQARGPAHASGRPGLTEHASPAAATDSARHRAMALRAPSRAPCLAA